MFGIASLGISAGQMPCPGISIAVRVMSKLTLLVPPEDSTLSCWWPFPAFPAEYCEVVSCSMDVLAV
jgi:hypothetical protein